MTNHHRRPNTAAAKYAKRQTEVTALLAMLGKKLADHAAAQQRNSTHYGFVGDLDYVAEMLRSAIGEEK